MMTRRHEGSGPCSRVAVASSPMRNRMLVTLSALVVLLAGASTLVIAITRGDGIAPGTSSWVTLPLAPGRDELVCNLPGHYAAGMYAQITVR